MKSRIFSISCNLLAKSINQVKLYFLTNCFTFLTKFWTLTFSWWICRVFFFFQESFPWREINFSMVERGDVFQFGGFIFKWEGWGVGWGGSPHGGNQCWWGWGFQKNYRMEGCPPHAPPHYGKPCPWVFKSLKALLSTHGKFKFVYLLWVSFI